MKRFNSKDSGTVQYWGVDVSKAWLDLSEGSRLSNDRSGHHRLVKLARKHRTRVVCESTGPYHLAMVCALQQAGIEVCVVNPAAVRSFGRALVQKAKSDRIDAGLLAEYGRRCEPRLTPTVSVQQLELSALVARRDDLIGALVAERNRLNQEFLASVRRLITRSIASLERLISQVEALLEKLLVDWPLLASKVNVLVAVRGVGKLTALSLLAHLPHLGCFSAAQIASISGTAPFVRQSGQWKGKSFTGGGKPRVRSSLYMAALAASRSNPVLKPFYQRLRSNGKPPKLALVALMRKLIIYLNSLLKPFFPIPISCPS